MNKSLALGLGLALLARDLTAQTKVLFEKESKYHYIRVDEVTSTPKKLPAVEIAYRCPALSPTRSSSMVARRIATGEAIPSRAEGKKNRMKEENSVGQRMLGVSSRSASL